MDSEVEMSDIIEIVRDTRDNDVLKEFGLEHHRANNNEPIECAMCGEPTSAADICSNACMKPVVEHLLKSNPQFVEHILTTYAKNHELPNGSTLRYHGHGYRNRNVVFWDAKHERIVVPFTEIDDDGSVPPIFLVGNGDFDPTTWIEYIDHNTFVFPNEALIREMKAYATAHPAARTKDVVINGKEYKVEYDPDKMKGKWYSAFLEVNPGDNSFLKVYPGRIEWREDFMQRIRERKTLDLLKKYPNEVPLPNEFLEHTRRYYLGGKRKKTRKHKRKTRQTRRRR
jgi:hypothetical protein